MNVRQVFGEASPAISAKLDEIVKALGIGDGDVFDLDSESGIMRFLDAILAGLNYQARRGMSASASNVPRSTLLAHSAAEWASSTDAQRLCDLAAWQDQTLRDAGLPLMTDSEREIYAGTP